MPEADYTRVTKESQLQQLYGTPAPGAEFSARLRARLLARAQKRSRIGIWFATLWPGLDTAGRLWLSAASLAVLVALVALGAQLLAGQGTPGGMVDPSQGEGMPGQGVPATAVQAAAATATPPPTETGPTPTLAIVAEPATAEPPAPPTSLPAQPVSGTIIANAGDEVVNVRSGPGAVYERVGTLENGRVVEVTGISPHREWLRVRADGLEGWVYNAFISVENPQALPCVPVSQGADNGGAEYGGAECTSPSLPDQNEQAIAAIRAFRGDPALPLTFREETQNPNADLREALVYMDDQGGEYWLDRETLRVAQWFSGVTSQAADPQPVETLRLVATNLAQQQSPRFAADPLSLAFSESAAKGSAYAFRWEDQNAPGHILFPFVQIVVRNDGVVLQYMNTLDLWSTP